MDDINQQNDNQQPTQNQQDILIPVSEEGQHQHDPNQPPAVTGEEEASGSAPAPTSDDDTGEMMEEVTGEEPTHGETLADIINQAEEERTRPPKP